MTSGLRRGTAVVLGLLSSLALAAWDQRNSGVTGPLYSVHFPEGTQVGYVVGADMDSLGGEIGLVMKTTDGGATWVAQNSPAAARLNSVYFIDDNTGYAVGDAGTAIMTTDGGENWTTMTVGDTDQFNYVGFPGRGQTGFIGVRPRSQSAKVLKTTNGGATWTSIAVGGAMNWTNSCAAGNDNIGVAIGTGGFVWGTTDGFATGSGGGAYTTANLVAAAFGHDDPNNGFLVGNDSLGGVIRSTADGGVSTWDSCHTYKVSTLCGVDMPTADFAYACGDSFGKGMILVCVQKHPRADFWGTTLPAGAPAMQGICFPGTQKDTGYACGGGGWIVKTTNRGIPLIYGIAEDTPQRGRDTFLAIAPNPLRRLAKVRYDNLPKAGSMTLDLYNASGRGVLSRTFRIGRSGTASLDLRALRPGAYLVKVRADGFATTRKLVIQR